MLPRAGTVRLTPRLSLPKGAKGAKEAGTDRRNPAQPSVRRPIPEFCSSSFAPFVCFARHPFLPDCSGRVDASRVFVALRQQLGHDLAMHIGQPEVAPLGAEGELLMIKSEQMQHGGVEVMHMDAVFHGVEAQLVGRAE